jgi:hypothetical protein
MTIRSLLLLGCLFATLGGCRSMERRPMQPRGKLAAVPAAAQAVPLDQAGHPITSDITRALEDRLASLRETGGVCSEYAAVLETSYREGRITLLPYMWRVRGRLASGTATPDGDMMLARDIDSLNVGVRTIDDVIWSMEHEAAHIALRIASRDESSVDPADRHVRACRRSRNAG